MSKGSFTRRIVVVAMVMGMVIGGGVAYAGHQFSDVPDGMFHDDIEFIADRGITLGCGGGKYCRDDYVTRGEMAAFMERATRVATPQIVTKVQNYNGTGWTPGRCQMGPFTSEYDQQAVLTGGIYTWSAAGETAEVQGAVQYRVAPPGGVLGGWVNMPGSAVLPDSTSATAFGQSASPIGGAVAMAPGYTYYFGINLYTKSDGAKCQMTGIIFNRMPGQPIDR